MRIMNWKESSKPSSELVCYRCGSFDIALLNIREDKSVYKCQHCGKVWIKRDVDGYTKE